MFSLPKRRILIFYFTLLAFAHIFISFQSPKRTWIAIGDSITYLNDHQDETGNRITKGYMTLVKDALPDLEFINQGHNGWTVVKIAEQIENIGLKKADIYTVFLGTNDWWRGIRLGTLDDYIHNTGTKTVMGSYCIIINKLKSLNPKAKVILITPMQRVDFVYINNMSNNALGSYQAKDGQLLSSFAEKIKKIGVFEGYEVIDLYNVRKLRHAKLVNFKRLHDPNTGIYKNYKWPEYIGKPFDPTKDEYPYPPEAISMTYDGLHPSDQGYKIISKLIIDKIKKN